MQVPVETVRTRTRRALEELRTRLDGEYGERARWLAALVPLLRAPAQSLPLRPVALLAVVAGLGSWLYFVLHEPEAGIALRTETPSSAEVAPDVPAPARPDERLHSPRLALEAKVPTPPAQLTTALGDLVVHVDWSDGTPAESIVVRVLAGSENPELHRHEGRTDALGNARFEALQVGTVRIDIDRVTGPERETSLTAGELTTFNHRLAPGFDVRGRVTDEGGQPIEDAEILLGHGAALANGVCVARSASDGSFFLRELPLAFLGARAAGYRPSPLEVRFAAPDAELDVHLRLARGAGEVRGRVLCSGSSEPVPEAWLRIGDSTPRGEWRDEEEVWGALVRTDAAGEFHAVGLRPGRHPVTVRAAGFGAEHTEVEVRADAVAELALALPPEAVLVGTVRDALGRPLAGQWIRVGPEDGPFTASGTSGGDGSFRVGSLAVARPHVAWIEGGPLGTARHEFVALPGQVEVWNAVLTVGPEVVGRVLDERGQPLAGWRVRIEDDPFTAVDADSASTQTAADGSFRFRNVHERAHVVMIAAPSSAFLLAERHGVVPGQEELLFLVRDDARLTARVVGTMVDEAGQAVPEMQVMVVPEDYAQSPILNPDPRTGAFDSGPAPSGLTQVYVRTPGRAPFLLGPRLLAPGETWDLGEVRLVPEGTLLVRLVGDAPPGPELELLLAANFEARFTGDGFERRSSPLRPGVQRLQLRGGEYEEILAECEVRSGQETVVELPLQRGWQAPVAVKGASAGALLSVTVQLPAGGWLQHDVRPEPAGETLVTFRLRPGEYPCEARADRRTAAGILRVSAADRSEPVLTLELR